MSPSLALLIWLVLLLGLFYFDVARESKASAALWVPLIWLFFLGSRSPSLWVGFQTATTAAQALEEGSPLDRTIFSLLTLAAFGILFSRSFQWGKFVRQNSALFSFLAFSLVSVVWSDFPFATFKKWFRDLGVYMAVLVVLSDPRPLEAVRTVLRRLYYLLIPLSIVLIKYYPNLGKAWSEWGGQEYQGVCTGKNMLGVLCLASGLFFFWDTVTRWHERRDKRVRRIILVNIAFIAMAFYLLNLCGSKTSTVCLVLGCVIIVAAHCNFGQRHINWLKALAPSVFLVYLVLTLGFGMGAQLSEAVGGSASMSDRTHIWQVLLSVPINPVIGTGYQSFWLGWRIQWVWARLHGDNVLEAHNGYIQTYLDLGMIGLSLVCIFLIATYRKICKQLNTHAELGLLGLGLWTLLLLYNVSEAAFGPGLLFVNFLMGSLTAPQRAKARAHASAVMALGDTEPANDVSFSTCRPLEMSMRRE
jgi:exopolysaccharide production protein ExoQ